MISFRSMFFLLVLLLFGYCSVSWNQARASSVAPSAAMMYSQPIVPGTAADLCDYYTALEGRDPGYYQVYPDTAVTAGSNTNTIGGVVYYKVWGDWPESQKCYNPSTGGTRASQTRPTQFCTGSPGTGVYPNYTCESCPEGYWDVNGTCERVVPCPAAGVAAWGPGSTNFVTYAKGGAPGAVCMEGCGVELGGVSVVVEIGGGLVAEFPDRGTYTGERVAGCTEVGSGTPVTDYMPAADTPDGVPNSQEDCPAGSAFGQVNGVNVCAPPGTKVNYVPNSSSSTNGGDSTESTTTKTDTVNADGSVTTTTTTSSGSSSSVTNVTNNYGTGFPSSGAGDSPTIDFGPAPPAESGDVTGDLPGPGSGVDGAGTAQRDFTVSGHFSGAGGCIADRTISAMGVDVVIPLSELCPWFDVVSKILTIVSVFLAMRILVMS